MSVEFLIVTIKEDSEIKYWPKKTFYLEIYTDYKYLSRIWG